MAYTKLDEGIVRSTVWREPDHILRVWIAMLALKNRHGEVLSSIPGLADIARVSLAECEEALRRFHEPDKYSRTQEHDGRRLETIPGGWYVLNHEKYRESGDLDDRRRNDAERAKRARERKKAGLGPILEGFDPDTPPAASRDRHVTSRDRHRKSRQADTHADADADTRTAVLTPTADFEAFWRLYPKRRPANSKKAARKAWNARMRDGVDPATMIAGVTRYAACCDAEGITGSQYVKMASTFLGPDEHYAELWEPPPPKRGSQHATRAELRNYVTQRRAENGNT